GWATERVRERLDRGVAAWSAAGAGVYVSWRLLEEDPKGVAFNVYRRPDVAAAPVRLNRESVTRTTDFLDRDAPVGVRCEYFVRAIGTNGGEGAPSPSVAATAGGEALYYRSIKLDDPKAVCN